MDGPRSTTGTPPASVSNPELLKSQDDGQSGISPLTGRRYTPFSEDGPEPTSIHNRVARVNTSVVNQVNRDKVVTRLTDSYKESFNEAESYENQLGLAYSIREIRHFLDNPAEAKKCSEYSILWIPDDGKPVSVIPPGEELKDRQKATELRAQLHGQLDKLEKNYTISQLQELQEKRDFARDKMELAEFKLAQMGERPPFMPAKRRLVFLDSFSIGHGSGPQAQLPTHLSTGQPGSGASPLSPAANPNASTPPVGPNVPPPAGGGKKPLFAIRFNEPSGIHPRGKDKEQDDQEFPFDPSSHSGPQPFSTSPLREQPPVIEDDEGSLFEGEGSDNLFPPQPERMKQENTPPVTTLSGSQAPPSFPEETEFDETSPLIDLEDRGEQELFDPLAYPQAPPPETTSHPRTVPVSSSRPRPRPSPSYTPPGTLEQVSAVDTQGRLLDPRPEITLLGQGQQGVYSDIFRPGSEVFESNLASVNAGIPSLGVEKKLKISGPQGTQVIGTGKGINKQFARELSGRGDTDEYAVFHQRMLGQCTNGAGMHYASKDDLDNSPGLAASLALKADLNKKGKNTGTVILDVFDGDHPAGNPTNSAMLYVVQPNGEDYDDGDDFLDDIEKTALRMTIVLQKHNEEAIRENIQAGREVMPVINTLRTCAFGAGQSHIHPDVSAEEVSQRIVQGIQKGIDRINQEGGVPLTITDVELEDGSYNVFSKAGIQETPKVIPTGQRASFEDSVPVTSGISAENPFGSDNVEPEPFVAFQDEFPHQPVPQPGQPAPFATPLTPRSNVLNTDTIERMENKAGTGLQLDKNRPPTQLVAHLQACPPDLGPSIEQQMGKIAATTLVEVNNQYGARKPDISRPDYTGKGHATRKAMLVRALVNFHRKYAGSEKAATDEGKHIPDHALPLIELGMICTRPVLINVLAGQGNSFETDQTKERLLKNSVPEGAAAVIANATTGTRHPQSQLSLLDKVVIDAEQIEYMRLQDEFDISRLDCYKSYPSTAARQELVSLCKEYRELLAEQRELHCGGGGSLRFKVGGEIEQRPRPESYEQPAYRRQQESQPHLFAEQQQAFRKHQHLRDLYNYPGPL